MANNDCEATYSGCTHSARQTITEHIETDVRVRLGIAPADAEWRDEQCARALSNLPTHDQDEEVVTRMQEYVAYLAPPEPPGPPQHGDTKGLPKRQEAPALPIACRGSAVLAPIGRGAMALKVGRGGSGRPRSAGTSS